MNRQTRSCVRFEDVAAIAVATATPNADPRITRFRPIKSASRPTTGAAIATPIVEAVTVRLTAKCVVLNTRINSGRSGCVAYRLRKAVKPARMTGKNERGDDERIDATLTTINAEIAEPAELQTVVGSASSAVSVVSVRALLLDWLGRLGCLKSNRAMGAVAERF